MGKYSATGVSWFVRSMRRLRITMGARGFISTKGLAAAFALVSIPKSALIWLRFSIPMPVSPGWLATWLAR